MIKDDQSDLALNSGSASRRARSMVREIGLAVALTAAAGASVWSGAFQSSSKKISFANEGPAVQKVSAP